MNKERDIIFNKFLEMYFFNEWEKGEGKLNGTLELIVSPSCNTKCSYCYYKNYGEELYCNEIANTNRITENAELLLKWLKKNNYKVENISIFSGEFLNLPYYKKILECCRNYFLESNISGVISIPTNSTFLFEENKTTEIENIISDFRKDNVYIYLSHSVDGKYLDNDTRKMRNGKEYDDYFYEKLFNFSKRNGTGFHPMVSAEGIKNWKKNYTWYVENLINNFGSLDDIVKRLYLLEVRNPDWKKEDLEDLEDFILFLIEDMFQRYGRDKNAFLNNFILKNGLNIFSPVVASTGRGISCSEQMDFGVRLGDLAIVPCHRTSYEGFNGGYFTVEEKEITGITSENPETYIMYKTFDIHNSPSCQNCVIGNICTQYCMGVNMEVNKDFYTPVETVCRMEFIKTRAMIKGFMNIGVLDLIIDSLNKSSSYVFKKKVSQILYIKNMLKEEATANGFYRD